MIILSRSNLSKNWRSYKIPKSTQQSKFPAYSFHPCSDLCTWGSFTLNSLNLLGGIHQETPIPTLCATVLKLPTPRRTIGCSHTLSGYSTLNDSCTVSPVLPLRNTKVGAQPWETGVCGVFSFPLPKPFPILKFPYPIPACLARHIRRYCHRNGSSQVWFFSFLCLRLL